MFRRYCVVLILLVLILSAPILAEGRAEIVYDVWSDACLYEKNADAPMRIASTTKLMTALIAAEKLHGDKVVEIKREHTMAEGSKMYLCTGEKRTVKELMYGLLLASGNDAAFALADAAGGEEIFVKWMNEKAEELGCTDTRFENPAGLDGEDHHSTARDLVKIAHAAFENETIRTISATRHAAFDRHEMRNHNKLLWKSEDCIGGKTGYTAAAGRCLVSLFENMGRRIIIVTLDDPNDWNDHLAHYQRAVEETRMTGVRLSAVIPVVNGARDSVTIGASLRLPLRAGEKEEITAVVMAPHFFFAYPEKDEIAGEFRLFIRNREVLRIGARVYRDEE